MFDISEIFGPVLQGEGSTAGIPAFFIRLAHCNLMCGGKMGELLNSGVATWWCDSETLWRQSKRWSFEDVVAFMRTRGELARILSGSTHIVFTGGEPTLPKNLQAISNFCDYLSDSMGVDSHGHKPFYEIETNGTYYANGFYQNYIDQINCSPKLSNSGILKQNRIVIKALEEINAHNNSWFKFVISRVEDWKEIEGDFLPHIRRDRIILMPAGNDIEELEITSKVVWNLATRENVRACSRLQIIAWRKTVGI